MKHKREPINGSLSFAKLDVLKIFKGRQNSLMNEINSIGFPKMFVGNSTKIVIGNEATLQNIKLLLLSEVGEFKYDPEYGIQIKKYVFEQNNYILKDILIDEIYTKLTTFFSQIQMSRKDIQIRQEKNIAYLTITFRNRLNFELNTYNLQLFLTEDR